MRDEDSAVLELHESVSPHVRKQPGGRHAKGRVLPNLRHERASAESFDASDDGRFPDAWYGSHGTRISEALVRNRNDAAELLQELIFGADDRVRIFDAHEKPHKWHCSLAIRAGNGAGYSCSGFLVGPRTVITAGHCVYMHNTGGWATSITVQVARNEARSLHTIVVPLGNLRSTTGWINLRRPESNYGAIILPHDLPSGYGFFDLQARDSDYLRNRLVNIVGYPADKPPGQLWGHGRRLMHVDSDTLRYDIDAYAGQSGAAVFEGDDPYSVVGIHNYGDLSGNSATRITDAVKNRIDSWL